MAGPHFGSFPLPSVRSPSDGVALHANFFAKPLLVPGTGPVCASTAHPSNRQSLAGNPPIGRGDGAVLLPESDVFSEDGAVFAEGPDWDMDGRYA